MAEQEENATAAVGRVAWHCACFNARRAARTVSRFYDGVLAPGGLSISRFSLLGAMQVTGPTTMSDLAGRLSLDPTTMTRNLHHLEKNEFIRIYAGQDRRARVVELTPDGERAVARSMPLWHAAQDRIAAAFGAERLRHLIAELDALARLLEDDDL